MTVRRGLLVAAGLALMVSALAAGYSIGRRDAQTSVPPPAPASATPVAPGEPSAPPGAPLTPIALGTADIGTVLFADGPVVWKFESSSGQLQPLYATPSRSRGHAMTFDIGGLAGFRDARDPRSPIIPPGGRAEPFTSDLSPDGSRIAYLVDGRLRVYEHVFMNAVYKDYAPEWRFSSIRWSPSGRYLAATGVSAAADPSWPEDVRADRGDFAPGTVYLVDLERNAVQPMWVPAGEARPPLPPRRPPIQFVSWSPDERYVLLRHQSVASGEDASGRDMFALELATGTVTPLGTVVPTFSWIAWRPPHTLAYVEGGGFEPWMNKHVRIWSPESGFLAVTDMDEVGVSPTWDATGRLVFVRGPADVSEPADASRLAVFDPVTGRTTQLMRDPVFADHAVRASDDGTSLLFVRRRLSEPLLEMWTAAPDGSNARPLWQFTPFWTENDPYTREHTIYEAAGIFEAVAWSR